MRTFPVIALLSGLLAGCSADWAQTSSQGLAAGGSSLMGRDEGPPISQMFNGSIVARLPDRGRLVEYGTPPPVRKGAYTWHPVQVSEAHALRAVIDGAMVINAPDGKPIRLRYERHIEHPDGNWTWIGHPNGAAQGAKAIVTFGEKAVFGSIPYGEEEPLQLTMATGRTWLLETDKAMLGNAGGATGKPSEEDFLDAPIRTNGAALSRAASKLSKGADAVTMAAAPISEAATASNTVDIVLGYTNAFAARLGGTSQAVTRLRYLVDLTNQAYVDSQVNGQVRLVQTVQVNYPDATSNQGALFELTGVSCVPSNTGSRRLPDQGQDCTAVGQPAALQPLIAAREQYGADLVSLIRTFQAPENGSCGVAWLHGAGQVPIDGASAAYAFSIVSDSNGNQFPDGGSTCREEYLAHELGHNMGLQHDRATAQGTDDTNGDTNLLDPEEYGRYPYSFGYSTGTGAGDFYTVMALRRTGQTGYLVFSNPNITTCGGFACGAADQADNARALGQTMPVIAAFRQSLVPAFGTWFRGDFDGDGRSDILWRNRNTGANVIWKSGNSATPQAVTAVPNLAWVVVGASDFDGDGRSDILWHNSSTGANTVWRSGNSATTQLLSTPPSQWATVGAGDFDGDGRSDILWRNSSTGANVIWKSAQSSTPQAVTPVANQAWSVVGVGDFNGDSRTDILWRNSSTGANTIWRSASSTNVQVVASLADQAWRVAGVGDFDGDNRADILWRNFNTGANVIWKSGNSATPQAVATVGNLAWVIAGVGDFDNDNRADILWRNLSTGANTIWKSGSSATTQAVTPQVSPAWIAAG